MWRRGATCVRGVVNFTVARATNFDDDLACWPTDGSLWLDGLTYDRLHGDLDVTARLRWLASGSYKDGAFYPQPYSQLAKFYRSIGRDGDARRVLLEREKLEYKDQHRRLREGQFGQIRAVLNFGKDLFFRATIGYGYRPFRPFVWLGALWLMATFLAHMAWTTGTFAPNSGPVQVSAAWQQMITCVTTCPENPALAWSDTTAPGQDWETFNSLAYAADLVIPIIDLNQTDAWTPSTNRGPWGQRLWRYGFLLNIAGWLITALGAAAITGIIRHDRD